MRQYQSECTASLELDFTILQKNLDFFYYEKDFPNFVSLCVRN